MKLISTCALLGALFASPVDVARASAPAVPEFQVETVWVVSPWGYGAYYDVSPGLNRLRCSGTGNLFDYWH